MDGNVSADRPRSVGRPSPPFHAIMQELTLDVLARISTCYVHAGAWAGQAGEGDTVREARQPRSEPQFDCVVHTSRCVLHRRSHQGVRAKRRQGVHR
eukprot:54971-Eustigmatos_ZCMA.PRE.1